MNEFIAIFGTFIFYCFYIIFGTHSQISFFGISFFGRTFPRLMSKLDITTFPRPVVQLGHQSFPTPCCPIWTSGFSHGLLV